MSKKCFNSKQTHRNDSSRGGQQGKSNIRENYASQIDFAHYLQELARKKDFILCHICFYFLAEGEDNNGSVALGMIACHLNAEGGHGSECACVGKVQLSLSVSHDWMVRLTAAVVKTTLNSA